LLSNKKPNVAVLLATFNGESRIATQLRSILNQKSAHIKVFVSDDCSTDKTISIINEFILMGENIEILSQYEKYSSASGNFFSLISKLKLDNYDYFAFSDQDDIWLEDKIESAIMCLNQFSSDGYSSGFKAIWNDQKIVEVDKTGVQKKYDYFLESPGPGCTFVLNARLFSCLRDFILHNVDKLREIYYHDWFIYAYARSSGYRWHIDTSNYILYVQHDDNHTGANIGISAKINRYKKVMNKWATYQAYSISTILGYDDLYLSFFNNKPRSKINFLFNMFEFRRSLGGCIILLAAYCLSLMTVHPHRSSLINERKFYENN